HDRQAVKHGLHVRDGLTPLQPARGLDGCRLHDLRHTVASALAKSGTRLEVTSAILGHSSVSFTSGPTRTRTPNNSKPRCAPSRARSASDAVNRGPVSRPMTDVLPVVTRRAEAPEAPA